MTESILCKYNDARSRNSPEQRFTSIVRYPAMFRRVGMRIISDRETFFSSTLPHAVIDFAL